MSAVSGRFTLDTNILVYAIDSAAGSRHELAGEIVRGAAKAGCWLTFQAISEFYSVASRKGIVPAADAADQAVDWLLIFPCASVSAGSVQVALARAVAGRASYWDALLAATAAEAGCEVILTEDMADGAVLGGIRIHNPFAPAGGLTEAAQRLLGV